MTITKVTDAGLDRSRIVTPIIINGDMSVAQRGTSITGITTNTYSLDRYTTEGDDCTLTISQDTSVPTGQGFKTSLKMDVTTANSSRDAGDVQVISQRLEGQNMQMLKYGTSSAEATTLSFWCRMSQTGTYIVRLYADDGDRHICKTFTIDAADTWEKKIINIPGDTAGTINNDNGRAMRVTWILDAGTTYTSGTLATSWAASANANRAVGITTGWLDSTSSDFYLTGVQWEVGEFDTNTIPTFPFESFGNNLSKCQRYYFHYLSSNNKLVGSGIAYSSNQANVPIHFPTTMRTSPSLDADTGTGYYRVLGSNSSGNGYVDDFNAFVIDRAHENATGLFINTSDGFSGTGGGGFYMITENSSASIAFDAEL